MSVAGSHPGVHVSRRPPRAGGQLTPPALAARWRAAELDRRLAAGEDPRASDALAFRARLITTRRGRRQLAAGLAGSVRAAREPGFRFTAAVAPHRPDVLDARTLIGALERRLRDAEPVAPRGVAMIRLLLTDGDGPLYRPSEPGALGSRLRVAAAALGAHDEAER